jgi:hypothetical protein
LEGEGGELRQLWEAALRAYRGLYKMYLKRIELMRGNPPPPDWDGVSVFDEK